MSLTKSKKVIFKNNVPKSQPSSIARRSLSNSITDMRDSTKNSLETTGDIEAEYIKSLQDQVRLCELENNYLRQQISKVTENQPKMTAEAESMLESLTKMQKKVESLELELFRKESHVELLNSKIAQLTKKLDEENDKQVRVKTASRGEAVNFRKDIDDLQRRLDQKNVLIEELKDDLQRNSSNMEASENKIQLLRAQLRDEMEKGRQSELELAEKRAELLGTDNKIKELEHRYITSNNNSKEAIKRQLQDEVAHLKDKLRDALEKYEKEQQLRVKLSLDGNELLKEINTFQKQNIELQNLLEKERSLRERVDHRRRYDDEEFERLKRKEQEMELKLKNTQEDLKHEQTRMFRLIKEKEKQDQVYNSRSLDDSFSRKRLAEMSNEQRQLLEANQKLEKDKLNLFDTINELEDEIKSQQLKLDQNQHLMDEMENKILKLSHLKSMDEDIQAKKWSELQQTIKNLRYQINNNSHNGTMNGSRSSPTKSLRNTGRSLLYEP